MMDFTYIGIALGLGIMGSFHCVGMCGPLALALPLSNRNAMKIITGALFYNFGRAFLYAILGLLIGLIGQTFAFFIAAYQQKISIIIGIALLFTVFLPFIFKPFKTIDPRFYSLSHFVKNKLSVFLTQKGNFTLFIIGTLNGLLPCGLVYTAMAASITGADLFQSIAFMFFFGLGTMPAMILVNMANGWMNQKWKNKVVKLIPYVTIVMAVVFILRGLNLGIPYLSPKISVNAEKCTEVICCKKK
jgi:hypothetical protein